MLLKNEHLKHNMVSSLSHFNCEICLWTFETKSELDIHNYLEHLIVNSEQPNRIVRVITRG
jgi:hypothetical protein